MTIERRVYRAELQATLGYGPTWFRTLQKRGVIPAGHRDPGGRREWYVESEARAIVEKLTSQAA
jgi:hypothetical protein